MLKITKPTNVGRRGFLGAIAASVGLTKAIPVIAAPRVPASVPLATVSVPVVAAAPQHFVSLLDRHGYEISILGRHPISFEPASRGSIQNSNHVHFSTSAEVVAHGFKITDEAGTTIWSANLLFPRTTLKGDTFAFGPGSVRIMA